MQSILYLQVVRRLQEEHGYFVSKMTHAAQVMYYGNTMQLPPGGTEYITDLSMSLFREGQYRGIQYLNSIVSGPGVNDEYDPDFELRPRLAAGYWPGGFLDTEGVYAATLLGGPAPDELALGRDRLFLRRLILESSIGAAALERYRRTEESMPVLQRTFVQGLGGFAVPAAMDVCKLMDAPFCYLVAGPVTKSEVIPFGQRVATLYYPAGVSPRPALANLRRVVRDMQRSEIL